MSNRHPYPEDCPIAINPGIRLNTGEPRWLVTEVQLDRERYIGSTPVSQFDYEHGKGRSIYLTRAAREINRERRYRQRKGISL